MMTVIQFSVLFQRSQEENFKKYSITRNDGRKEKIHYFYERRIGLYVEGLCRR